MHYLTYPHNDLMRQEPLSSPQKMRRPKHRKLNKLPTVTQLSSNEAGMEHWFKKQKTGSGHRGGLTLEAVVRNEGWLHFLCKRKRTEAGKGRGPSKHIFSHDGVAGLRPALNNCLMNQKPSHLGGITRQGDWGSTCSSQGPFQSPVEVVYQMCCAHDGDVGLGWALFVCFLLPLVLVAAFGLLVVEWGNCFPDWGLNLDPCLETTES